MSKRNKLFSVEDEVALHPELNREQGGAEDMPEPSERDGKESSRARYYASTAFEPGVGEGDSPEYREMVRREQSRYPDSVLPVLSVLSGIVGGLFAVPAIFLNGIGSLFGFIMLVFLGPFAEESLKQSGTIFQLEKMPGSLRFDWQFFLTGMVGGAVFSVLENLIYEYIYLAKFPSDKLAAVMAFRWTVCMALHVLCTVISWMGLRRVWRESLEKGRPCRIADAFPWFAAATFVHGLYNCSMLFLDPFE